MFAMKLAHGLSIQKSSISGNGCFATIRFSRGKKIAEYSGERISDLEAQKRARNRRIEILLTPSLEPQRIPRPRRGA